ncbi:50S ribosomal protein L25/general stress protein Ctc [Biformimicrobium ophioploci]|uniref:Large ribosomal subunit protein bL25 n=1 Tax=Biformimicrobium ophioploci TaxID=3036711 RepID=A0ABQ6LWW8_9GAMM|nr:50S ribosomal protein L25/general stress protein Ctc [Microbulbifer sp. NKW57]GMG86540.1 50S ribosomal protein L25/general stress protein Ctc [Microbulbifer sp. NKW57]
MSDFTVIAKLRSDEGKGASRRLRRLEGLVPAVVYGGKADPVSISLVHKDLVKQLENDAFYASVINLDIDGKTETVILRDLQRHPAKAVILHADFQRVSANTKVHVKVPLHFINEDVCAGVKAGGVVQHTLTELDVVAPASKLPEFIEVDMAGVELDGNLHISDLKLPEGVESTDLSHDHDLVVASIHKPRAAVEAEAEGEEAAEGEEGGEE